VKNIFSRLNNLASTPLLWLFFHGGLALALALSLFFEKPLKINTNLFDILPSAQHLKAVELTEKVVGNRNGRQISILVGNPDFLQAKEDAERVNQAFIDTSLFETLFFKVDENAIDQIINYFYAYRYSLLDPDTYTLLQQGAVGEIAEDALAAAFAPFTLVPLDRIALDPFLLTEREIRYFLNSLLATGGGLSLRDEVLAAEYKGMWYVLLQGILTERSVSLANMDSGVEKIYAFCAKFSQENPNTRFVYTGFPFHNFESSSNAQQEISRISIITALIIMALFWRVFQSPLPALISATAAGISILFAAGTTLLWFREIHLLTFVFGTTLTGTCVDYSIHYFCHRKGNPEYSGGAVRSVIMHGVTMSFASTALCFVVIFFAPFSILRQFSLFSIAGLFSSFLSVLCIYPLCKPDRVPCVKKTAPPTILSRRCKIIILSCVLATAIATLFYNRRNIRIENNLTNLYTMSDTLRESENIAAKVLNRVPVGGYFIISGATPEETLCREEQLRERLDNAAGQSVILSYAAASLFIPSLKTQRAHSEAAEALLLVAPAQYAALGFPPDAAHRFTEDFSTARNLKVVPDSRLPAYLERLTDRLWLGNLSGATDDLYYSCVIPLHSQEEVRFRRIAEELEGVFFTHKTKDMSVLLDELTAVMLNMFATAYLLLCLVMRFFYPLRDTVRICAIPLITACITVATLSILGISLGFFSAVGMILVFGLGLDYMFYLVESNISGDSAEKRAVTQTAIGLSFITTALSFGALGLSAFMPVRIFGLTVLTGLTGAFISTLLIAPCHAPDSAINVKKQY
jgi:predicted exporter